MTQKNCQFLQSCDAVYLLDLLDEYASKHKQNPTFYIAAALLK